MRWALIFLTSIAPSLQGPCEMPPPVDNGYYGNCRLPNGTLIDVYNGTNPHDVTDEVRENAKIPVGTTCELICGKLRRSMGPAVNSRYNNITCSESLWVDKHTDPLPENIRDACSWKTKLCHPTWTWKQVPKQGEYTCRYPNNTAVMMETFKERDESLGLPEKTECRLKCDSPTIDIFAQKRPESRITCEKFMFNSMKDMGWKTGADKVLMLENLEFICFGCKPVPEIENGKYTNCKIGNMPLNDTTKAFPHDAICELVCDEGMKLNTEKFKKLQCKVDMSIDWTNGDSHVFPFPPPDVCVPVNEKRCSTKIKPNRYGGWTCDKDQDDNGYILGTICTFRCFVHPDVNETFVDETYIDPKYRVNCTEEGWIDLNTTNHIDQTDMEKCPIRAAMYLTVRSKQGQDLGDLEIGRRMTKDQKIQYVRDSDNRPDRANEKFTQLSRANKWNQTILFKKARGEAKIGFITVQGTWFIGSKTLNRSHFPKYVLKKVDLDNLVDPDSSNPDENLRPIEKELDFKGNLSFKVYKSGTENTDGCGSKGCILEEGFKIICTVEKEEKEKRLENREKYCKALSYDMCMEDRGLDYNYCDKYRTGELGDRDFERCDKNKDGGMEQFYYRWQIRKVKEDNSSGDGNVDSNDKIVSGSEPLFLTLVPDIQYTCSVYDCEKEETGDSHTSMSDEDNSSVEQRSLGSSLLQRSTDEAIVSETFTMGLKREQDFSIKLDVDFELELIDIISDEKIEGKIYVRLRRKAGKPSKTIGDPEEGFDSEIFDKTEILTDSSSAKFTREFEEAYKEFGGAARRHEDGLIRESVPPAYWSLDISTTNWEKDRDFEGYYTNPVYEIQNFRRVFYFLNLAPRTTDGASYKRKVYRQIILSVAVFDHDCFKFCNGHMADCVKKYCQSLDLDKVKIEVEANDPEDEETKEFENLERSIKTEMVDSETRMLKMKVRRGKYRIKCSKRDNDKYLDAPKHTTRFLKENVYYPCLLHKKLKYSKYKPEGRRGFDEVTAKIAIGWDKPRNEISNDFNVNIVIFQDCKAICSIGHPKSSICSDNYDVSNYDLHETDESESVNRGRDWYCKSTWVGKTRDRCCNVADQQKKTCRMDEVNRGLGFDTILLGERATEDSTVLVYIAQAYSRNKNATFKDSSVELSIQMKDRFGKEMVRLFTIHEDDLNDRTSENTPNVALLQCIDFKDNKAMRIYGPENFWLHYLTSNNHQDLEFIFGNKVTDGFGKMCQKCQALFCKPKLMNDMSLTKKRRKKCCCCAKLLNKAIPKPNNGDEVTFKCPFDGHDEDYCNNFQTRLFEGKNRALMNAGKIQESDESR